MNAAELIAKLYDRGSPQNEVAVVLRADKGLTHLEGIKSVRKEGDLLILIPANIDDPWAKNKAKLKLIRRDDEPQRDPLLRER